MDKELREQLKANFRKEVFAVLELISSREAQLEYQQKAPIAHVSAELFNQWEDCYQVPKAQEWYVKAFSAEELKALEEFNRVIEVVAEATPQNPPGISEFVETGEWAQLADAARNALSKCREI